MEAIRNPRRGLAIAAILALCGSVLCSVPVSAAEIFDSTPAAGGDTYIGTYNPTTSDFASFNNALSATGTFTDTYLFNVSPSGIGTANADFLPTGGISGFTIEIYSATATCGTVGASCTGVTLGSLLATGTSSSNQSMIDFVNLLAGTYALVVTGDVSGTPATYSGQLLTEVPEPVSLAILGSSLIAFGVSRRRRRKVVN